MLEKPLSELAICAFLVIVALTGCTGAPPQQSAGGRDARLEQLIGFFSRTVHAGQVAAAMESEAQSDPGLFDPAGHSADELRAMLALADSMVALGGDRIAAWVDSGAPDADIERLLAAGEQAPAPLDPRLPYNVYKTWLEKRLGTGDENSILAMSNEFQLITEVERDGDLVQDLMMLYLKLGLKQCISSYGMPGGDLDTLLAIAEKLAPATGKTPFELTVPDWQLLLYKIEMWEAKNSGRRDKKVLAAEMIASDPVVISMLDKLKSLPPKRVAFLGHSLTMSLHWSTYASWCDLAAEIVAAVNPDFSYADINSGGLSPNEADERGHLDQVREFKPRETYILMSPHEMMSQVSSVDTIIATLKGVGSECYIVDGVRPWVFRDDKSREEYHAWLDDYCAGNGIHWLAFQQLYKTENADTTGWRPLKQDIHMNTPGHVFYAYKLLELWIKQAGK